MNCPKCQKESLKWVDEDGVELDYCPKCGGIWFDENELDAVLGKHKKVSFNKVKNDSTAMTTDYQTAMCPVCQVVMKKVPEKNSAGIMLDQCPQCNGIWLDGESFIVYAMKNCMLKLRAI